MSRQHEVICTIFEGLRTIDPQSDVLNFSTEMVKAASSRLAFKNPFTATKFDTYEQLPPCLKESGFFILHTGRGNHIFIKGTGYHEFEAVKESKKWLAEPSVVERLGTAEASALSTLFNNRVLQDFLWDDPKTKATFHAGRRTNVTGSFRVGRELVHADWLQVEFDGAIESEDTIVAVEAKSGNRVSFEIRQPFSAQMYFDGKQREGLIPRSYNLRYLYIVARHRARARVYDLHEYGFKDRTDFNSISPIRNCRYTLQEGVPGLLQTGEDG